MSSAETSESTGCKTEQRVGQRVCECIFACLCVSAEEKDDVGTCRAKTGKRWLKKKKGVGGMYIYSWLFDGERRIVPNNHFVVFQEKQVSPGLVAERFFEKLHRPNPIQDENRRRVGEEIR